MSPLHTIVVVMDSENPRWDDSLKTLIAITVSAVSAADDGSFTRLGFIYNKFLLDWPPENARKRTIALLQGAVASSTTKTSEFYVQKLRDARDKLVEKRFLKQISANQVFFLDSFMAPCSIQQTKRSPTRKKSLKFLVNG